MSLLDVKKCIFSCSPKMRPLGLYFSYSDAKSWTEFFLSSIKKLRVGLISSTYLVVEMRKCDFIVIRA